MIHLSKSKYCALWQCPKMAWLNQYKPEVKTLDASVEARMAAGNEVGDLAMGLFGDYVEVTAYDGEKLDLGKMIENTRIEMEKGTPVICEAAFSFQGLYCAVDLLKKDGDGWAIHEVKSSTNNDEKQEKKPVYIADISYQKYVLEHCGVKVTGTYLVCINNKYVFDGKLNIQELFYVLDVSNAVAAEIQNMEKNLAAAEQVLTNPNEPDIDLGFHCRDPYDCAYWDYCTRHVPSPSVFNLSRMAFSKKIDFYHQGLTRYDGLLRSGLIKNKTQLRQMQYALNDLGTFIQPGKIRQFLDTLSYPLYFLDFETMQPVIPLFPGTSPYQQIPFQYSLHYIKEPGGEIKHREFLAVSGEDPRRGIAESLVRDIPADVCVTAYNKTFECGRLKELANQFPDLSEHLLQIESNIVDLLIPFLRGYYYNRAMGGSFSIKSVLPAVFPDDPELDYHNLEGVHNGGEAMTIFPQIQYMEPQEQEAARHNLLKYCELDTYAMVKLWQELERVANE